MPSTLFVAPPTAIEAEAEAEAAFQQSVLRNECDIAICEAAFRTVAEWRERRRQYESRLDARRTLDEVVPTLKAKADELEKAATVEIDLGDWVTLGQLREQIAKINPTLATATPEQLARALTILSAEPLRRQAAAMNARMRSSDVEREAICRLNRTSPSTPNVEAIRIRQAIQERQSHIASRRWALIAEENIPAARQRLAAAKALPENVGQSEWTYRRDEIRSAQQNLTELMRLAKTKGQAERDNAADQAEIGRLQIELQTAEQRQRDAALIPTNMVWGD